MAVHPLRNEAWGFESNCFVCEPRNTGGLRIPFFHDDEAGAVTAEFSLDATFSGAPSYVHGGVLLAVLDEAMAWATIAVSRTFALTKATSTTFLRPVKVGETYRVEARITGEADDRIDATATILRSDGKPCAEASAELTPLSPAQAVDAIGEVTGDDTSYLRG